MVRSDDACPDSADRFLARLIVPPFGSPRADLAIRRQGAGELSRFSGRGSLDRSIVFAWKNRQKNQDSLKFGP